MFHWLVWCQTKAVRFRSENISRELHLAAHLFFFISTVVAIGRIPVLYVAKARSINAFGVLWQCVQFAHPAMMSLTWLSAAMEATYKREHVVNIGKLTMNTYFLKRHVLAPLSWLLTLNTNITFCWINMCLKHKCTTFEGPATFEKF